MKQLKSRPFSDQLRSCLSSLIQESEINRATAVSELQKIGWRSSDLYQILLLSSKGTHHTKFTLGYYCQKIEWDFPSIMAIEYGDNIICLQNHSKAVDPSLLSEKISCFLRDNLFQSGISEKFNDFFKCAIYRKEASFALSQGSMNNPTIWLHHFSSYAYQYCISKIKEEYPVSELLQPALKKLYEYDRNHPGIELVNTLYQFMIHQYNATETAEILHIHRTTLLYRLNKMQEIAPFDLKKPSTQLHLLLSFALAEEDDEAE